MAMEIYALSDRRLNSIAEWQQAIDAADFPFPLRLSVDRPFTDLRGFLPVQYEGRPSGFECDHWNPRKIIDEYSDIKFGRSWSFALAFRFGARPGELESAWMAATAYADATRGAVFDTEEGKIFSPVEAAQLVRTIEGNRDLRAEIAEQVRRKLFPGP